MTKFKVGDRVRLVNNSVLSALNLGWEGTVVEVRGYEDEYYVLFDEQDKDWSETDQPGAACSGHEIELVEEKKNISFRQLGFKVGDRVRCVSLIGDWGPCGDGPYYPGDEFTLVENRAGEPVIYASDGGLPWYGDAGSWELVTETKQEETNVETAQFYPYSVTDTNISVFVAGRQHVIPAGTKNFDDLKEHLKTGKHDYDTIMSLSLIHI